RRGRDAQVDVDALFGELLEDDASVLRQPALGDVEVAHDLQTSDKGRTDLARQAQFFLADAVDAVANDDFFLPRLDVDVGRAQVVGVLDDAVGQLDDRAGVDRKSDV